MNILFDWCGQSGVKDVMSAVKQVIEIIRIIVPIGLIIMTTLDVIKKVINPDDKDGQKKILQRLIAAIIIFFIPTIISLVFKIADISNNSADSSISCFEVWRK